MKYKKDAKRKKIYVVGYPKSGNTWVVRLLSDVLNYPVCPTDVTGALEIASEINQHISENPENTYEITKLHFLPQRFFKEAKDSPIRVVYIYRDFRDIVVSSFFYWNQCSEVNLKIKSFLSLLCSGPIALLRYCRSRRRLFYYTEDLCSGRIDWFKQYTGTWSQHLKKWRDVSLKRSGLKIVFVAYEELLNETPSTVLKIIRDLHLPKPSAKRLQNAIERQSFKTLKSYFLTLPDNADVPFGKKFNLKFLRKGISGDWKIFLSRRMAKTIQAYHGEMLFELGYEVDPSWYKKVKTSVIESFFIILAQHLQSFKMKIRGFYNPLKKSARLIFDFNLSSVKNLIKFFNSYRKYRNLKGAEELKISDLYPCIYDNKKKTPFSAHYFYQGVWAFSKIKKSAVKNHIDVGSEIRWVGLLSTITKVTFIDIRPFETDLKDLTIKKGNILSMPFEDNSVFSLSCLHVAEHVGLGRYGDKLDPSGTKKACKELSRILAVNGNLYFSVPVGKQKTCFNAHRIHAPKTIIGYFKDLELVELSGITDSGEFIENIDIEILENSSYACGLFYFQKKETRDKKIMRMKYENIVTDSRND